MMAMMDWARQIHLPKESISSAASPTPSKRSGPARAQHHSCDAPCRQKSNPSIISVHCNFLSNLLDRYEEEGQTSDDYTPCCGQAQTW